jgi:hypothetical protein
MAMGCHGLVRGDEVVPGHSGLGAEGRLSRATEGMILLMRLHSSHPRATQRSLRGQSCLEAPRVGHETAVVLSWVGYGVGVELS